MDYLFRNASGSGSGRPASLGESRGGDSDGFVS